MIALAAGLSLAASAPDQRPMANALAVPLATCVARRDTPHPAFAGCIDWHSAVHGTCALVAYARMTGDRRHDALVREVLDPIKLAAERRYLRDHPNFELPYGRAWLLRLAREWREGGGDDRLDAIAEVAAASLLRHYAAHPPVPHRRAYDNAAWALINLRQWFAFTHDRRLATVDALIRDRFVSAPDLRCGPADERPEFMAVCANWAWAASLVLDRTAFAKWIDRFMPRDAVPTPIAAASVHENGLNFSRAWGLSAAAQASGRDDLARAARDHLRVAFADRESWAGSYDEVGHWVAQFGMLAVQRVASPSVASRKPRSRPAGSTAR